MNPCFIVSLFPKYARGVCNLKISFFIVAQIFGSIVIILGSIVIIAGWGPQFNTGKFKLRKVFRFLFLAEIILKKTLLFFHFF